MRGKYIIDNIVPVNMKAAISIPGGGLTFGTGKTLYDTQDFIADADLNIEDLFALSALQSPGALRLHIIILQLRFSF